MVVENVCLDAFLAVYEIFRSSKWGGDMAQVAQW